MLHFQGPPSTISLRVPGEWPPMILNRTPVEKSAHLQSLLKSLVDEPPAKFTSWAPMENDVRPLTPPSGFPEKEKGEHLFMVHGAPCRWKACIQWGTAWFPKGIVHDTAVATPVLCSLQHDTFHLRLGRPEPC